MLENKQKKRVKLIFGYCKEYKKTGRVGVRSGRFKELKIFVCFESS